jgi:hypothetical protein
LSLFICLFSYRFPGNPSGFLFSKFLSGMMQKTIPYAKVPLAKGRFFDSCQKEKLKYRKEVTAMQCLYTLFSAASME